MKKSRNYSVLTLFLLLISCHINDVNRINSEESLFLLSDSFRLNDFESNNMINVKYVNKKSIQYKQHILKNGIQLNEYILSDHSEFNRKVEIPVYNTTHKSKVTLIYYLKKMNNNQVEVYDALKNYMYTNFYTEGKIRMYIENKNNSRSCFKSCMDRAEEAIVDNLVGWIAWNYSPGVQIAAALSCSYCCGLTIASHGTIKACP